MSINYAILGILSVEPLTGYDLKKIMQDSPFLYWSGNNNQVYKALLELHDNGYVTSELLHQDAAPSKKVYTITDTGLAELRIWSLARPELPELKNPFLVQLAWTRPLRNAELLTLLGQYEEEVQGRLFLEQRRMGTTHFAPARTPRESALWSLIDQNVVDTYQQELRWIERVRQTIGKHPDTDAQKESQSTTDKGGTMQYSVIEKGAQRYILVNPGGKQIRTEQDGLDLVALCAQHGTSLLMIQAGALVDDFFRLRTGLAGAIAQKFTQYGIKAALVLDTASIQGKFQDFIAESNRGTTLRAYADPVEAETWLLGA